MSASATSLLDDLIERLQDLDEQSRIEIVEPALRETADLCWVPNPGPQTQALETEADELFYGGSAGGGKALDLETKLPTPAGWTTMGAVRVGDSLYDESGNVCQVVAVSPVMIGRPCYSVRFSDGAEIVADAEHLWATQNEVERSREARSNPDWKAARRAKRKSRATGRDLRPHVARVNSERAEKARLESFPSSCFSVRTTRELHDTCFSRGGRLNHSVGVAGALAGVEASLPVDPYLLGAWLGDGSSRSARMCMAEEEVVSLVSEAAGRSGFSVRKGSSAFDYGVPGGLLSGLRELRVLGNKHIPRIYLRAPTEQRLAVLQGLMDTDGYADPRGQCEYTTTSAALAADAAELIRSLGCKVAVCVGVARLNGRDVSQKFRLKFMSSLPAFRLGRKVVRQKTGGFRETVRRRYIESVEPVPSRPVRCVQVDSPSRLYLAGEEMVPTHNSDLLIGAALTRHRRSLLLREYSKDAKVMAERAAEIRGDREGFAMSPTPSYRDEERGIDFGGCRDTSEMQRHKGVPYDLFGFDEITDFSEVVFRFIKTWNRTTTPGQRCRVICTGNPPTDADGAWIIEYWGPWLDPRHPNPAAPGELRWYAVSEDGKSDIEVDGPGPHLIGGREVYARSRTYIPAALEDNPDLTRDGQYRRVLDSLSGVFRAAYRDGNFAAAMSDQDDQVIPTWWVMEAQKRWTSRPEYGVPMSALGVDVAQGGADSNIIAPRYDGWFAELIEIPGELTPVGTDVAPHIITARKNGAAVVVDCGGGYGGGVVKTLRENEIEAIAYKGAESSTGRSRDGNNLKFANKRAEVVWRFREALDPDQPFGSPIALPPDRKLAAELCAFTRDIGAHGVKICSADAIKEKLGRSPDRAVAVMLAWHAGERNIAYLYSGAGPSAEDGIPGRYGRPGLQKRANVKTRYNRR